MNSVVSGVTARSAWEEKLPQDYVVAQHWDAYGDEEHRAWRQVLARNSWMLDTWGDRVHPEYVAGLAALSLPDRIPRVEDINERLEPTGWRVVCVDGYVPTSAYVALMASSIFPMSRRIRRLHNRRDRRHTSPTSPIVDFAQLPVLANPQRLPRYLPPSPPDSPPHNRPPLMYMTGNSRLICRARFATSQPSILPRRTMSVTRARYALLTPHSKATAFAGFIQVLLLARAIIYPCSICGFGMSISSLERPRCPKCKERMVAVRSFV